eukprot:TRINITY_DN64379_c0_g1_i1.p1 TRINITY_DN64379_c0_g1~~TRINITY_DN64379_c0_g1_i1.p1  ORF type:complete len:932 (-),score=168.48 TRINITY_DN64379_c0_g1_i1:53-2848(-)
MASLPPIPKIPERNDVIGSRGRGHRRSSAELQGKPKEIAKDIRRSTSLSPLPGARGRSSSLPFRTLPGTAQEVQPGDQNQSSDAKACFAQHQVFAVPRPTLLRSSASLSGSRGHLESSYEAECKRRLILPKFARSAQVGLRGEELDLSEASLGDDQLAALLCDSTLVPLGKIRCWKLCGCRQTHLGAKSLGSSLQHGVKVLNLARNELGVKGIESVKALTAGHCLTQMRSLNLSFNCLRNDAASVLCEALLDCQLLLRLDLNCNDLTDGSAIGALLAGHCNLTRLAAHANHLNSAAGAAIFQGALGNSSIGGKLADIDVAWNRLGEGSATACAQALSALLLQSSTLFHLDLSYNRLGAESCKVIAAAMRDNHQLYGLHMVGNAVAIDGNGFLIPLQSGAAGEGPKNRLMYGDPREGPRQLLGAARQSSCAGGASKKWSDDEILRDRDPLEQQTACWACEGWERVELAWTVKEGEEMPLAVWAFTNIDNFRSGLRLRPSADGKSFKGARMIPPEHRLLVIFQVGSTLLLDPACQEEILNHPVTLELCCCEELPRSGARSMQVSKVGVAQVKRSEVPLADSGLAGVRVVLLDGPNGPMQMPRVTETEFRSKATPVRQKSLLAAFCPDSPKLLQKCFALDWSMAKKSRLIPEAEDATVAKLIEPRYGEIVAIYRYLSAIGVSSSSGFGVTSLDAANFAVEAGLVDGQATRLCDVDRLFIASNVMSSEQRKDMLVRNDKQLVRFQFLEFILRIADQHFRQSKGFASMTQAVSQVLEHLRPIAEKRLNEISEFFAALRVEKVEDVYRQQMPVLAALHERFSGRTGQLGKSRFMSFSHFQDLLERIGAYDADFQQRQAGLAFRLGMMTREDECYDSRFQEMNFVEFLHALGAAVFLRAGFAADSMATMLEEFLSKKLIRGLPDGAIIAGRVPIEGDI